MLATPNVIRQHWNGVKVPIAQLNLFCLWKINANTNNDYTVVLVDATIYPSQLLST